MSDLIIYTLPVCPACKILKQYLRINEIPFEERDARNFLDYLRSQGFTSVPILELDGELFQVNNLSQLKRILQEAGYQI